jgi:hypothetical protein
MVFFAVARKPRQQRFDLGAAAASTRCFMQPWPILTVDP